MKKIVMALIAVMTMGVSAMAQDEAKDRKERRPKDKTEMVKMRTNETVKKYGLNDEQAKKLLDLNTQYADKLGGPGRGQRPRGEMRPHGDRNGNMRGIQRPDSLKGAPLQPREMNENREQMRAAREAYDKELQGILTPEQYQQYKADEEQRMKQGPRGGRGQRPSKEKAAADE